MELYVLFGHRREEYEGQHGVEALACTTEYEYDENPDYLNAKLKEYQGYSDFEALAIVTLVVDEWKILEVLHKLTKVKAEIKEI